jgi:hypothetical protein
VTENARRAAAAAAASKGTGLLIEEVTENPYGLLASHEEDEEEPMREDAPMSETTRGQGVHLQTTTHAKGGTPVAQTQGGTASERIESLGVPPDPKSVEEALSGPWSGEWRRAMDSEMASLKKNDAFELVPLPTHRRPIGCKWVFKVKVGRDGRPARFKARLVGKGYTQV